MTILTREQIEDSLFTALDKQEPLDLEYSPSLFISLEYDHTENEDGEQVDFDSEDADIFIIHFHSGNPDEDEESQDGGALEIPVNPSRRELNEAVEFIMENLSLEID